MSIQNIGELNGNKSFNKMQNDQLITIIEKTKFQNDTSVTELENFKKKYDSLYSFHTKLQNDLNQQRKQSQKDLEIRNITEKKFKEQMGSILATEKKLSSALNQVERLEHESALYKTQIEHFKSVYNEMEQRKNTEIKCLTTELASLRMAFQEYKSKAEMQEEAYSDLKFANTKLNQDIAVKKSDCDHLTKTLEDCNNIVLSAQEKEKHFDSLEKSYKKRIEELTIELETSKVHLKMQIEQKTLMNDDSVKSLQQKNDDFETLLQYNKNQYEEKLGELNDESSIIKGQMVSMKIERDKYYSEYNILRKEINKMNEKLRGENEKYLLKCQEYEQSMNRIQIHFQDKTRLTMLRNETLEKENKELTETLDKYTKEEEMRNDLINRKSQNEDDLTKELVNIKESYEQSEKERKELEKKYLKLQIKYKQLEDLNDMQVNALESTLKIKKNQCELIENKVYELMKTQEDIADKMKQEFLDTQKGCGVKQSK